MPETVISQPDFIFDFEDLDVVADGKVEIDNYEAARRDGEESSFSVSKIILVVNNHEIPVDDSNPLYSKLYEALIVRIENKIKEKEDKLCMWLAEVRAADEYENRKGA